ncbi:MAG TPA: DUF5808 domain-containing protein [Bryobacteraceae bacterium]|nr:DUF5808 domain-containing protein [Bryobacteraceae bacterium]
MSSRDWNTIGAQAALPRWIRWAIPPLLIPLAGITLLSIFWDRIPPHFGHPLMARTPLHVFGFAIFAEGLAVLMVLTVLTIWYGSGRPAAVSPGLKVPLAVAYMESLIFTAVSLSQLSYFPPWSIAATVPLAVLALIVYLLRSMSEPDGGSVATPDECWSLSGIYYNPKDSALFVRARVGYGYTFNMANPWARRIMIGFISGIVVLIGFLIWSLQ